MHVKAFQSVVWERRQLPDGKEREREKIISILYVQIISCVNEASAPEEATRPTCRAPEPGPLQQLHIQHKTTLFPVSAAVRTCSKALVISNSYLLLLISQLCMQLPLHLFPRRERERELTNLTECNFTLVPTTAVIKHLSPTAPCQPQSTFQLFTRHNLQQWRASG